jgi:hypothetical protein
MTVPRMLVVLLALAIGAGAQQPSTKDNASAAFDQPMSPAMVLSGLLLVIPGVAALLVFG